jgi:uncharacterized membrane protein
MINKLIKLIKANLLGIAVALGVCSFIYEGLINYSPHFTLTKYFGALVIIVAIYYRYKVDLIKQNCIVNDKKD